MIDSKQLLADLKKLLKTLEADTQQRLQEHPDKLAQLDTEWRAARDAKRTAATQFDWRAEQVTQAAVHWILGTVFLRFLEDNGYVDRPFLFGATADQQALATDRHDGYFRSHPEQSDREYLLDCFAQASRLAGLSGLFDARHNPLFRLEVSGDGAMSLRGFWLKIDPDSGRVLHDFTDPAHDTRFLGDLYQDLSAAARERYALLQTPDFVEEFILDRTLTPAIETFGYRTVRLIDPTCGSGHFLLDAFRRLFRLWTENEPGLNAVDRAQRALEAVHGVDLNPFAVEIARFRLLVAALHAADIRRLVEAPDFKFKLATGDSLLHGRSGLLGGESFTGTALAHLYAAEDAAALTHILGQQYHAVVGNPPYIVPKDAALNSVYRHLYETCHMKYSLGVPFTERFFDLTLRAQHAQPAGFMGMITTNSFMKREFGTKLIERFLPRLDLTHVIDTSGAHIPGHGTPTVILFGRHRPPVGESVRTVMGIKGEPSRPSDPAQGLVWRAIVEQLDQPDSEGPFVSVVDTPRATFAKHPWSIGGGGASELKQSLENARPALRTLATEVGITSVTGEDDLYVLGDASTCRRLKIERTRPLVLGDAVRDWGLTSAPAIWLYDQDFRLKDLREMPCSFRLLWVYRSNISKRKRFGTPMVERGLTWYEWQELYTSKLQTPLTITFAEVATHNHFVLDCGGKVFKQTAPVIKLGADADESSHFGLLGLLNSSLGCFWLKQVCQSKGGGGINEGHRGDRWEFFFQFNSTKVAEFPLAEEHPAVLAARVVHVASRRASALPAALCAADVPSELSLVSARNSWHQSFAELIALQEELDWQCYRLYGLLDEPLECDTPPSLHLGERAFEIVLARRMAAGEEETTWFARHGATPIVDLPAHWPGEYRRLVERRIATIEGDRGIGLIERPEYKRRWNVEPWDVQEKRALRDWLLDRLESDRFWPRDVQAAPLATAFQLADRVHGDADFMQVAALYTGRSDFEVSALLAELLSAESVPFLPALRYTETGLSKRTAWETTWALQRREDAIEAQVQSTGPAMRQRLEAEVRRPDQPDTAPLTDEQRAEVERRLADELAAQAKRRKAEEVGAIPVPPKYKGEDFAKADFWRLRGPLDVPKERFVSYPSASRDADGSLLVTWAGYDALQQARALAGLYIERQSSDGWLAERLLPLLAGLDELVPWLKQWHNDIDMESGQRMGDYFEAFVQDEARGNGSTQAALRAWRPAASAAPKRRRKSKAVV